MTDTEKLVKDIARVQTRVLRVVSAPAIYLCGLILEPSGWSEWGKVVGVGLSFALVLELFVTGPTVRSGARRAVTPRPDDRPGDRLGRLLGLPIPLMVRSTLRSQLCVPFVVFPLTAWLGRSPWLGVLCFVMIFFYALLAGASGALAIEAALQPEVREEFHRTGGLAVARHPWERRQSWFLPFLFAGSLVAGIASAMVVMGRYAFRLLQVLVPGLTTERWFSNQLAPELLVPLLLVVAGLVFLTFFLSRAITAAQLQGTRALAVAVSALAEGQPKLPDWVSTDELGDLAFALAAVFSKLKGLGDELQGSARELVGATEQLGSAVQSQLKVIDQHKPVLAEALQIAAQIRQSSEAAGQQAQAVVSTSAQAELLGLEGGRALEQTAAELQAIRAYVTEMADKSRALGDRMTEVLSVTDVVKQLADQSSLLALNAAVEAVRAGAQGKGFSIVAREMRTLSDQSLEATRHVREILEDLARAAAENAKMTEQGHGRVEASLSQVRGSGESLGQLLGAVQESATAARQIFTAIDQQTGRVQEVSAALQRLAGAMQGTLTQLSSIDEAQAQLVHVGGNVRSLVERYGLMDRM